MNFTAMIRLVHKRALTQLALKTRSKATEISKLSIWGNHSPTMYHKIRFTTIGNKAAPSIVDSKWVNEKLSPRIQKRGNEVMELRKLSSAGNAGIDHIHGWVVGSEEWKSI